VIPTAPKERSLAATSLAVFALTPYLLSLSGVLVVVSESAQPPSGNNAQAPTALAIKPSAERRG
jgi:hypothetical protein